MKNIIFVASLVLTFGLTGVSSSNGQILLWNAGTSNWFTPANWTPPGPPLLTDDADINNGGTAQVAAAGATAHVFILGDLATESGTANVSGAGTLAVTNGLYVAQAGTGTLNITGGGDVTSVFGFIGLASGSNGTATVAGAGSTWGSGSMSVGSTGTGTLNITTGGAVSSAASTLGFSSGAVGTVTVNGAGSMWTLTTLDVGLDGTGTLNIEAGADATVNGAFTRIGGHATGTGTVTITGAGSTLTLAHELDVGRDGTGTLNIQSGGVLTMTGTDRADIGAQPGGVGTATVTGSGSMWTMSGPLRVGDSGNGMLHIASGGVVSNTKADVGVQSGSTGAVTVDGTGSTWTNSSFVNVGGGGTGSVAVTNGAHVTSDSLALGTGTGVTGTVTVDGTGSKWTSSGATVVGEFGNGILNIQNGGLLSDTDAVIANKADSVSTATIDGTGSTWTNSATLTIGSVGDGTMTIQNGGTVTNTNGTIASAITSTGAVTVTGMGSTWTNSGSLAVGGTGNATMDILNGGAVSNTSAIIADVSIATVTVDGAGSTWTNTGDLLVGKYGSATLNIRNGGVVTNVAGEIAQKVDNTSTVTVDGTGSTWTNTGGLKVGSGGHAFLHILNGGTVTNTFAQLGSTTGSSGTATIDGAGSLWDNNGTFIVGSSGTGMMTITNGGRVASNQSLVGGSADGDGTVIVDGTDSTWSTSSLFIGGDPVGPKGTGLVRVLNGGEVTSGNLTVWNTGTLELGASFLLSALPHFDGGTLRTIASTTVPNNIDLLACVMRVVSGPFTSTFSGIISGPGGLFKFDSGAIILTNTNTYTGITNVNQGSFIVDGSVTSDVNVDALLGGTGTIFGNINNGGVVSPGELGASAGTLTSTGNYAQSADATLRIEIGGLGMGEHDLLLLPTGTAMIDGTLQVLQLNGFLPHPGDSFTVLLATGGVTGEFLPVTSNFPGLIQPHAVYNPTFVDVVFDFSNSFGSQALTPNQKAVAHNLDRALGDPLADELTNFLGNVPLGDLPHDYDLIAPEELAAIYEIGFSQTLVQNMNLQHRMDDIRAGSTGFCGNNWQPHETGKDYAFGKGEMAPSGAVLQPAPDNRWGTFATGSGNFVNVDGDSNAHGYDITTGSFTVGADYRVGSHFAIGVDGGYSGSNADLVDNGEVEVDGVRAGAYATVYGFKILGSNVHVDGAVGGGWNTYDTHRTGLQDIPVRGNTDGSQFNAMIAYGADWIFGCLDIGTWSTIQYTDVDIDGFTESGSLAPLHIEGQDEDSLVGTSGVRVAYDWHCGNMIVRPEIRAAWMHESNDRSYAIDSHLASGAGDTFTVHGPKIGRDAALVDAGVAVQLSSKISAYIYYDGVLGRGNYNNNSVSGGLRISF